MGRITGVLSSLAFWSAAVFSILIALVSYRFVPLGVEATMDFVAHNLSGNQIALFSHIGVAPIALLLMPFQFMTRLRSRYPGLHRWMGRVYVASILISGLAGLQLAFHSTAGTFASLGFALLSILWLWTTIAAFIYAYKRQISRHKRWMLRSAALTFAAVTLRVYLGASMAFGADFQTAYVIISWACWVPNALLMEAYLWSRRQPHREVAALKV